jgi:hypothetical protein
MIGCLLRWILILSGLLALPVLLIRAQPYDSGELRAFLTPPQGCPAPCFMGIRPRITSVEYAIRLLQEHEWVQSLNNAHVDTFRTHRYPAQVAWQWSGRQSSLIDPDGIRELRVFSGTIVSVDLDTRIAVGDLKLGLGQPDTENFVQRMVASRCSFAYTAWYQQFDLTIISTGTCPLGDIYQNKVSLHWRLDR